MPHFLYFSSFYKPSIFIGKIWLNTRAFSAKSRVLMQSACPFTPMQWRALHQLYKGSLTFTQSNILPEVPIKPFLCGGLVCKFLSIVLYLLRSYVNHLLYLLMRYSCDRFAADKCLALVGMAMNKWYSFSFLSSLSVWYEREKCKTEEKWQRCEHQRVDLETKKFRCCAKHLTNSVPNSHSERPIFY